MVPSQKKQTYFQHCSWKIVQPQYTITPCLERTTSSPQCYDLDRDLQQNIRIKSTIRHDFQNSILPPLNWHIGPHLLPRRSSMSLSLNRPLSLSLPRLHSHPRSLSLSRYRSRSRFLSHSLSLSLSRPLSLSSRSRYLSPCRPRSLSLSLSLSSTSRSLTLSLKLSLSLPLSRSLPASPSSRVSSSRCLRSSRQTRILGEIREHSGRKTCKTKTHLSSDCLGNLRLSCRQGESNRGKSHFQQGQECEEEILFASFTHSELRELVSDHEIAKMQLATKVISQAPVAAQ